MNIIGKPWMKVDALSKVKGETLFADDIFLPRMAYGKILRSPHPHALIKFVDPTAALQRPGVYAVITGKDLPIRYGILPVSQDEELRTVLLEQRGEVVLRLALRRQEADGPQEVAVVIVLRRFVGKRVHLVRRCG